MQRAEFDRLLAQCPVVRSSHYRRGWEGDAAVAASSGAAAGASSASPVAASPSPAVRSPPADASSISALSSAPAPVTASASSPMDSSSSAFFSSLLAFLRARYSEQACQAVMQHFRAAHAESLKSLSLDDMEILAKSMAANRKDPDAATSMQNPPAAASAPILAAAVMDVD